MIGPVRRAVLLVALEGVLVIGLGVVYAGAGLLGAPQDRLGAEVAAVLTLALGAGLLLVARGLDRRRRWARSPAVVVQLFALPVGYGMAQNRLWVAAAVLVVLPVAVLLQLAAPEARLAFEDRTDPGAR